MIPDFLYGVTPGDVVYDIETYPNVFTFTAKHYTTGCIWYFEISEYRNDIVSFCKFIDVLRSTECRMVGFNNIGFDYPVIHFIYQHQSAFISVEQIYQKAMDIINANGSARFSHIVWESDWLCPQIDLYKIHHFDNKSKSTGLKILEFNMRMDNIEDLPFAPGTKLTAKDVETLKFYNLHDVNATILFLDRSRPHIELRDKLSREFQINMMNMSDVKIGETILILKMGDHGISCYEYVNNKRVKKQTKRNSINLKEVIFPYVSFERSEFNRVKEYLESKVITETKGVFKGLTATIEGLTYSFGTGGLHASVESQIIHSDNMYQIVDVDVASFYPNLGIKNRLYPAHLGREFCDAYEDVYNTRKTYPKGSPENEAFKLALNGAYGGSNNEYSPFYDPFYTMSITINGQLLLCVLIEQMLKIPGLRMIQANTDGITYLCPREYINHSRKVCRWWESLTNLELEEALYNRMMIRDVNSYIAEKEDGSLKRIGAYAHVTAEHNPGTRELPYHKDWSARIVPLAAEAALVRGEDITNFIINHDDIYDFMLRTKVPRGSRLEWGGDVVSNIVRYYISTEGKPLEKVMPPKGEVGEYKRANKLTDEYFNSVMAEIGKGVWDERIHTKNKSTYQERRSALHTGYNVMLCNNLTNAEWAQSNYHPCDLCVDWYIAETEKLVNQLL